MDSLRVSAPSLEVPRNGTRALSCALAIGIIAALLGMLAARTPIPPLIESDYCYLLTAAERWHAGLGPTTTPPVAPHQPWEWTADWSVLTKWPLGYPAMLVLLRRIFGWSTLQACQVVACIACAATLVGWFLWLRRVAPRGLCGLLIAAVAASCAMTTGFLVNPSTDLILIAVIPYLLLLVQGRAGAGRGRSFEVQGSRVGECEKALERRSDPDQVGTGSATERWSDEGSRLILAGLLAGGLFWIRYASLFVPAGIGLFLAFEWVRRRIRIRALMSFAVAAAVPIVALILLNRAFGPSASLAAQLNLGESISPGFSWNTLATAWWMFTDFGYYSHHAELHWLFAILPVAVVGFVGWSRGWKSQPRLRHLDSSPGSHPALKRWAILRLSLRDEAGSSLISSGGKTGAILGACVLFAGLGMLVVGSTFFRAKFDFVGLERYYLPLRPLYFALFVAPLACLSGRAARGAMCIVLVVAGSWTLQQEWGRDLDRWAGANRAATPYGQWSRCFEPGATELFAWLKAKDDPALVVLSNFHEFIALETMIPALPIPPDRATLDRWLERIAAARGVPHVEPIFVLDPDNRWRSGWIAPWEEVVREFALIPVDAPRPIGRIVFAMRSTTENETSTLDARPSSAPLGRFSWGIR